MSLLLTVKIFLTLFCFFYCWLWTGRHQLDSNGSGHWEMLFKVIDLQICSKSSSQEVWFSVKLDSRPANLLKWISLIFAFKNILSRIHLSGCFCGDVLQSEYELVHAWNCFYWYCTPSLCRNASCFYISEDFFDFGFNLFFSWHLYSISKTLVLLITFHCLSMSELIFVFTVLNKVFIIYSILLL